MREPSDFGVLFDSPCGRCEDRGCGGGALGVWNESLEEPSWRAIRSLARIGGAGGSKDRLVDGESEGLPRPRLPVAFDNADSGGAVVVGGAEAGLSDPFSRELVTAVDNLLMAAASKSRLGICCLPFKPFARESPRAGKLLSWLLKGEE